MRVLTVYAHNNPHSFCHAFMCRFTEGLVDAGHTSDVVDLYAIGFDPVLRGRDTPGWIDDSVPDDVLEHMNVRASMLERARNPLQKWMMKRWMGDLDARGIVRKVRARAARPTLSSSRPRSPMRTRSPSLPRSTSWASPDTQRLD